MKDYRAQVSLPRFHITALASLDVFEGISSRLKYRDNWHRVFFATVLEDVGKNYDKSGMILQRENIKLRGL